MKFKEILKRKERAFNKNKGYDVKINSEDGFFRVNSLSYSDLHYLIKKRFKLIYSQNLYGKKEFYLLNSPVNESLEHFFLVQEIKIILKSNFDIVYEYKTKKPDLVFRVKNRDYALEIETGKSSINVKKRILEKINLLKEMFGDDWFFVVTNRNLVKRYKKYGKTLTRKNLIKRLSSYVNFPIV
jgi:hypothetical protein